MLSIIYLFLLLLPVIRLTLADQWYSKSQCTQKEFANHMDINCNPNELILIGWSHYGTKKSRDRTNPSTKCEPSENDCIMDYTHKIAELCNGVSKCEVVLTQQFIHKCSDEATYLYISYQCIKNSTIVDVCSKRSLTSTNGVNLISPMFPNEYPNNVNCTCAIESKKKTNIVIDVENLSFNLQDNDRLASFSGTIPFGASLLTSKSSLSLNFQTDETLSQSGFWIRLYGYQQCNDDEYVLGSKCIKIFSDKQTWTLAHNKCRSIQSKLIHLHDIIQEKKLAYFLSTNQQYPTSFWIAEEKENYIVHSWWPWRSSSNIGKCILRTSDGWLKRPCTEEQAFICERDINRQSLPLTIRCGNPLSTTISSTTFSTTTAIIYSHLTTPSEQREIYTQPKSSTESTSTVLIEKSQRPTNIIDSSILAAIIGGICVVVLSVNIVVCYICKKRLQRKSQCKTQNDSNSSFTHEELHRSLMQHLYHEQTNTISSTSTSSCSSKQSQSKSNDTTTTISSPPHLPNSSQINANSAILCYHTPQIHNDTIDYHVYETIPPSETSTYTIRTPHSAFQPVLQSNTHTIRPYHPRTNIFHHSDPSKPSYEPASSNPPVIVPICCHHYSSQCPTGTLRRHVLPSSAEVYSRTESIV
ncbi:unnamed protein product [Adineta ricciae]|uniref:Uncharacterized protein n=1 Tax=Adineta ricciae TaxID=249248 RepID=A0A815XCT4_ADIRI|nr:unnamed protein product [Adineta ricciae]